MILPLPRKYLKSSIEKGFIKKGSEIFKDGVDEMKYRPSKDELDKFFWMTGDIAPCEVTIID